MKLLLQPKRIKNKNIYYSQWIEWIFFQFLGKSSSLAARFSIQSLNSNRSDQIKYVETVDRRKKSGPKENNAKRDICERSIGVYASRHEDIPHLYLCS